MSFSDPLPPPESVPPVTARVVPVKERLPNASVGRPYKADVAALFGVHAPELAGLLLRLPDGFGLGFDPETSLLQGDPLCPGEFELSLEYTLTAAGEPLPPEPASCLVKLTVNPDPVSLWKNRPSDPDGPFAKTDSAASYWDNSRLRVLAASLRGRSHAHEGGYRDDDFSVELSVFQKNETAVRESEEPGIANDTEKRGSMAEGACSWSVFLVADGAGSAKFSRRGAELACRVGAEQLREQLQGANELEDALGSLHSLPSEGETVETIRCAAANLFTKAAYQAFSAIHREAAVQGATLRDFATTFIAVVLRPLAEGWFFAAFSIGDGGAGLVLEPGHVEILTKADSGEHAGATLFLTKADLFQKPETLLARTRVSFCKSFRFLAVMTDGVSDPLFPSDAAFESAESWKGFEEKLLSEVEFLSPCEGMEERLLEWLHFRSPGNHDDRTLLLVVPGGGEERISPGAQEEHA